VTLVYLVLAGLLAGFVNALAGGGTFVIFPALLFAGVASVKANATASLVVVPGGIAIAWVYRRTLVGQPLGLVLQLLAVSLVGSLVGSLLLLNTPNATFSTLVPWLLLIAAVVFTAAPWLRSAASKAAGHKSMPALFVGQFIVTVYGGYFGAGMGVIMIALFLAAGNMDIQAASGIRVICATSVNLLATLLFAFRGAIQWKPGIPMLLATISGGYVGARLVRRMNDKTARNAILVYAWVLTAYFFIRSTGFSL
jgi:uncharacterized membrane protein YfcA